ncbi:MAG: hypothetical protein IPK76_19570 [Lewinellaceae bacterium]|nr:hypothetical protein [Lewinellaceae bacterium]
MATNSFGCTTLMNGSAEVTPFVPEALELVISATPNPAACETTVEIRSNSDVTDIGSLDFGIEWPAASMDYVSFSPGVLGAPFVFSPIDGLVSYSWSGLGALAANDLIVSAVFRAEGCVVPDVSIDFGSSPPATAFTFEFCDIDLSVSPPGTLTVDFNDNIAPTWTTLTGALDVAVECTDLTALSDANDLFPVADDNCDDDVTDIAKKPGDFVAGGPCPIIGTYTNTWVVTDACNNTSEVYTQVITVRDETNPTASNPTDITGITCINDIPVADPELVIDEADACSTVSVAFQSETDNGGAGCVGDPYILTRVYRVSDACGNFIDVSHTITVVDDVDPEFAACPTASIDLDCNPAAITEAQAIADAGTVTDACGTVDVTAVADAPATNTAGCKWTQTWTVTATDACGNDATCQ